MSKDKGLARSVLLPVLLAVALTAGVAALLSDDHETQPPLHSAAPAAKANVEPPARPEEERSLEPSAPPIEPSAPSGDLGALRDDPGEPSTPGAAPKPFTPEQRLHAQQMIALTVKNAVEKGQVEPLHMVRKVVLDRPSEMLLSQGDIEALDLIIECMEQVPAARDEARDLLEFGTQPSFAESLRRACE